ncbi:MAG: 50S ribosomal protein L3 [bacterium]|nr:50S ribosomal protein L3 [bacterium]
MRFLIGKKQYMSQVWGDDGRLSPVTVVSALPITVTRVFSSEKDGYNAVQVGFGARNPKNIKKSVKGQMKEYGNFIGLKEFRLMSPAKEKEGDKFDVKVFTEGDIVTVSGVSKGKGFQGVVKRHNFAGGRRTHGQKHSEREPGSIGGGLRTRVPKGMRMAGRMGGERVTIKNLKVVKVVPEENLIFISGAMPGRRGTLVEIRG